MLLLCKWGVYVIDRSFRVRRVQMRCPVPKCASPEPQIFISHRVQMRCPVPKWSSFPLHHSTFRSRRVQMCCPVPSCASDLVPPLFIMAQESHHMTLLYRVLLLPACP